MIYRVRKAMTYQGRRWTPGETITSSDLNWHDREEVLARSGYIRLVEDQTAMPAPIEAPARKGAAR